MGKKFSKGEAYNANKYKIEEIIETLSEGESTNWGKFIVKARFEDNPSTIDIRRMKIDNGETIVGKGISLNDKECDKVVNSLAKRGYGDTDVLDEELKRRRKMYGFSDEESDVS